MKGLQLLRDAVIDALKAGGVTAIPAYPGKAKDYPGTVVTVDVGQAEGKPLALGSYLGSREEKGESRELYGCRMDFALSLEVRGEKAGDCEAGWEAITDILGNGALPSGIRLLRQSWEGLAWDAGTGRFLRRGSLGGSAYFIAERDAETAALLDLDLKGVVRI